MSGIPYNELQPIEITAKDDSGETVVLETLYFSLVIPCRDCKHYMDYEHEYEPNLGYCGFHDMEEVRDSRFCAWGERAE